MECKYKEDDFISPISIPIKLHFDVTPNNIVVSHEISDEVFNEIKSHINDCLDSYRGNLLPGMETHLKYLNSIIGRNEPLPAISEISESGIFEMCLDILKRYTDGKLYHATIEFLLHFAQSSPKYLKLFATEVFKQSVESNLKKDNLYLYSSMYLIGISNIILKQNSELSLIFKNFEMSIIPPFIEQMNKCFGSRPKFQENEEVIILPETVKPGHLAALNKNVSHFVRLMSSHPMDHDVWTICYDCVLKLLDQPYLTSCNSQILTNLIYMNSDESDQNEQLNESKFEMLTNPKIVEFVKNNFFVERSSLFIYAVYFLFKFKKNIDFFSYSINDIIINYFKLINGEVPSEYTENDDILFIHMISNLLIIPQNNDMAENPDVKNFTNEIFNKKLPDFSYKTKKSAVIFFCCYISIDANAFFSDDCVNYSDFMDFFIAFINDTDFDVNFDSPILDDITDFELISKMMECMIKMHLYIKNNYPNELERFVNLDCLQYFHQFIQKYECYMENRNQIINDFIQVFPESKE